MAIYQVGETVIISVVIKNSAGTLIDPATSTTISIKSAGNRDAAILAETNMTRDSTGNYHYDWTAPATSALGEYTATIKATNSARISIGTVEFTLE